MAEQIGTDERPLRVAIVGSGPSGFYAAGALLKADMEVKIDMFDRLPAPHGLVRYGVAPDHQNIKAVSKIYDRTSNDENVRFFGNVDFGRDVALSDLQRYYDQIIFAVGAQSDRRLNIEGEDLPNSMSATEFVAWYNGHPDYVNLNPDLSHKGAVVVGVGNVAMDVARILAKTVDELKETDIADHALAALAESKVEDIYVLARRGPAQVKFTAPEIREFGHLADASVIINEDELTLDPASQESIADDSSMQKIYDWLTSYAEKQWDETSRRVHFLFLRSPKEILSEGETITGVRVEKNKLEPTESGYINSVGTGEFGTIDAGLVLRSVGYRGVRLPDVPFNERRGIFPNEEGRIVDEESGEVLSGLYVVGWAKRGPTGVIGTNKPDAVETVEHMLADAASIDAEPQGIAEDGEDIGALLDERNIRYVNMNEWHVINELETSRGEEQSRPRVKMISIDEMLKAIDGVRQAA